MQNTKNIKNLIDNSIEIGDTFKEIAITDKDIGAAKVANQAYTNAVRALTAQILYKKLSKPNSIKFLEDEQS